MRLKVINSGSKGNGYALITGEEILLLECGVPAKEMLEAIDYQTSKVCGCLSTHVHNDHIGHIKEYMKYGINIYTSDEVQSDIETVCGEKTKCLQRMKKYSIGSFDVIAFQVPHNDTECDGFLITYEEIGKLLFITDAEYCPYDFSKFGINHVLVECNYSEDYINKNEDFGKFEHVLRGHMELQTCKRLIRTVSSLNLRSIGLLHLSSGNGNPRRFRGEIRQLVDCDVDVWVAEKEVEKELRLEPF